MFSQKNDLVETWEGLSVFGVHCGARMDLFMCVGVNGKVENVQ